METKELYKAPFVLRFGTLIETAKGSSGNDSEGCSGGKYENDSDEEE